MSPRRALVTEVLLAAVAGGTFAGCGESASNPPPTHRGILFPATYSFTGATAAQGTFIDSGSQNTPTACSDFGRQGIGGGSPSPGLTAYFVPKPPTGEQINGQRFTYESFVSGYRGPGSYTDPHILVELTVVDGVYTPGPQATLQLDARADGSGSVHFADFTDVGDTSRSLSGEITWTCHPAG